MDFEQLLQARRSANNFMKDVHISKEELTDIFNLVKLAPSAFNLQHTKYVVVQDDVLKEQVREAAYGQYKVSSASAVILVLGDKKAYKNVGSLYEGLLHLGILSKQEYDKQVEEVTNFYVNRGEEFEKEEAIRNASLSAMQFMLAAKAKGWDTCPMIGFDANQIRDLLHIPEEEEIVMMIVIGKEKVASRRPRGYRKPVREFVTYK
ncbi:nitroreductase family protein [Priestia taiwanensis]|uniref:NAD(P)H nitroreductase MhqN n=1 Tax=Priestia taiwanensis TaxID=1347902 RepID=A0A917AIT2_9BACI|nr:nitroreductase family protein [Priestia taiwanensis]MBM7361530.1 putative NAD(P)H nitroreductase [Priestia taiwanensis]GGE54913.1 putative NAD(P)H nitroreductase MhqN [Priestia taiwanensis]